MSLPLPIDEATLRALDAKCAKPDSVVSRRIGRQLSAESLEYKTAFLRDSAILGLGHLVLCALEAKMPPASGGGSVCGS